MNYEELKDWLGKHNNPCDSILIGRIELVELYNSINDLLKEKEEEKEEENDKKYNIRKKAYYKLNFNNTSITTGYINLSDIKEFFDLHLEELTKVLCDYDNNAQASKIELFFDNRDWP